MESNRELSAEIRRKIAEQVARIMAEAGADAPVDYSMQIKKRIAELAFLMAQEYGGHWRIQFEPEVGFVYICRRLPSSHK